MKWTLFNLTHVGKAWLETAWSRFKQLGTNWQSLKQIKTDCKRLKRIEKDWNRMKKLDPAWNSLEQLHIGWHSLKHIDTAWTHWHSSDINICVLPNIKHSQYLPFPYIFKYMTIKTILLLQLLATYVCKCLFIILPGAVGFNIQNRKHVVFVVHAFWPRIKLWMENQRNFLFPLLLITSICSKTRNVG